MKSRQCRLALQRKRGREIRRMVASMQIAILLDFCKCDAQVEKKKIEMQLRVE